MSMRRLCTRITSIRLAAPLSLLPMLLLGACASHSAPPPPDAPPPPMTAQCNAEAAAGFVGKPASESNVQAAMAATGAKTLRVIKPGQAVTMDYRDDRANLHLDAGGRIERISCG